MSAASAAPALRACRRCEPLQMAIDAERFDRMTTLQGARAAITTLLRLGGSAARAVEACNDTYAYLQRNGDPRGALAFALGARLIEENAEIHRIAAGSLYGPADLAAAVASD